MTFLGQLKLWQKLAVLIAAMALPTALLAVFISMRRTVSSAPPAMSSMGRAICSTLGTALAHIANHRSRSHALLNGDNSRREDVFAAQNDIDKALTDLDAPQRGAGRALQVWPAVASRQSAVVCCEIGVGEVHPRREPQGA